MNRAHTTLFLGAVVLGLVGLAACTDESDPSSPATTTTDDAGNTEDADSPDATPDAEDAGSDSGSLTGVCADTFGDALTAGFGRIDGVVYAVQKPSDTECAQPNGDHVIVQVLMNGAVYRLVTNVQSTQGDPDVRYATLAHALPDPAWAEGWHEGAALDYAATLDAHTADFTPYAMNELVDEIAAQVKVGAKISVYGESGDGRPESAHNIHKMSGSNHDGAIVVDPTGSPKFLLFHFDEQTF